MPTCVACDDPISGRAASPQFSIHKNGVRIRRARLCLDCLDRMMMTLVTTARVRGPHETDESYRDRKKALGVKVAHFKTGLKKLRNS